MFKRVGNRYWYRVAWACLMLVLIPTSKPFGSWVVVVVWELLMVAYLVVTLLEIRERVRSKEEPEPAPLAFKWRTDWVNPSTIGLLVVVFAATFVIARIAAP